MRTERLKYFPIMACIFFTTMCRKPYNPPAIKASNHFLSIDGFINTSAFASTEVVVSRSLNLSDSVTNIPELNAQVVIQSSGGAMFPLIDTGFNGTYVSASLSLDNSQKYQLSVTTSDGNKYLSDLVSPKISPAIDSVTWQLVYDPVTANDAIKVFVNTHDPAGNTRYYRWDYTETYQHRSKLQSFWGLIGDSIFPFYPVDKGNNDCWSTSYSNSILLGTSIALSSDVISQAQIAYFAKDDPKMDVKYSVLVRQYPLDFESYSYWITVQKNSQSLGGLFDLQPSQIRGNIHSVTNPGDPVLGYVSASSVSEMRMFIDNHSLPGWKSNSAFNCPVKNIPTDPLNTLKWSYPDTAYYPYFFSSGNPPSLNITLRECVDCRYQGGTNIKPAFWQ